MDNCHIDIYERLPAPFGLARYGVAPDHEDVKNCINRFEDILRNRNVSFFGNIHIPTHISLPLLNDSYHATVLSYGATSERMLNIPGESLESVVDATTFVGWYNGHPEMYNVHFNLSNKTTAVIVGNGNVALDIARMLFKSPELLKVTDITSPSLKQLSKSAIRDLYIIGRRGPLQSSFTSKELREICNLPNINIHIDAEAFNHALESQSYLLSNRPLKRLVEIFLKAIQKPHNASYRNIHFLFNRSPTAIFSSNPPNLSHIALSRNTIDPNTSQIISSEPVADLPCHILFKSIGYKTEVISAQPTYKRYNTGAPASPSLQITHLPRTNSIRNISGRIVDLHDKHVAGMYVSGWLKSGPVGVIASTMYNAQETADCIIKDVQENRINDIYKPGRLNLPLLKRHATSQEANASAWDLPAARHSNSWGGIVREWNWMNVNRAELDAGTALGKTREKIVRWDRLIGVGRERTVLDDEFKDDENDDK